MNEKKEDTATLVREALGQYIVPGCDCANCLNGFRRLAARAIVVECEVGHHTGQARGTWVCIPNWHKSVWVTADIIGTPGRALAIIIPTGP